MYKAQDHSARKPLVKHQHLNGQSEHASRPISSMCVTDSNILIFNILRTQLSNKTLNESTVSYSQTYSPQMTLRALPPAGTGPDHKRKILLVGAQAGPTTG